MKRNETSERIKKTALLAVFTALAFVSVMVFRIKVSFLTFDIKDALICVSGMIFGPVSVIPVSLAVSLIEMLVLSETGVYGFIMNVLSTVSFAFTASLIYKLRRNLFGAVMGLISGVLAMTSVMLLANLFITPFYMGCSTSDVAGMIPTLLLPFNAIKATLNAAITLLIYKPVITALRSAKAVKTGNENYAFGKRSAFVTIAAVAVGAASVLVFIFVLGGEISFFG